MKFIFENESFSFEALRTAGFASYGGANLCEVLSTASHIGEGDEASSHQAWKATAQRVAELGEQAVANGHRVSAREALLRACNPVRAAPTTTSGNWDKPVGSRDGDGARDHDQPYRFGWRPRTSEPYPR